ncbi:unnamed protein product [Owenia fusiformis]|uniref:Uncharacterized protein n=1 Tax=Owenia fusiformis TaxID=6347 RepID=A0A8J1U3X4_OWEFU|nr:unnamed protein product [Owenia fusiformis]
MTALMTTLVIAIIVTFGINVRVANGKVNWYHEFSKCNTSLTNVKIELAQCKGQQGPIKECPLGFTKNEKFGSCYNFVTRQKMIWIHALAFCTALGANLAAIETQEELTFIQEEIVRRGVASPGSNADSFYTGGTSINGAWEWIGGPSWPTKPMEFAPWVNGQGATGDQLCHTLWAPWGYLWGDIHCTSTYVTNFICEITLD